MEEKSLAEKQADRLKKLEDNWLKVIDNAKGENLKVGEAKSAKLKGILAQLAKLGVPKNSWSDHMKQVLHLRNATGVTEKVLATEDVDRIGHFAKLTKATGTTLSLFSEQELGDIDAAIAAMEEGQDESERSAKAKAEDDEDDEGSGGGGDETEDDEGSGGGETETEPAADESLTERRRRRVAASAETGDTGAAA